MRIQFGASHLQSTALIPSNNSWVIPLSKALQQPGHPFSTNKPLATQPYLRIDGSHELLFDYTVNVGAIFYGWVGLFAQHAGLDKAAENRIAQDFQVLWEPFLSLVQGVLVAHPKEPAQPVTLQIYHQKPVPMPDLKQPDNPAFADYFRSELHNITGLLSRFVPTGKAAAYAALTQQANLLADGVHNLVGDVIRDNTAIAQPAYVQTLTKP